MQPNLFNNSNLFYELGKNWKYTQPKTNDQHFRIQILNLWMNWEKLFPNLSFPVENEMGNLHKKWMVTLKLKQMAEIFHFLKF